MYSSICQNLPGQRHNMTCESCLVSRLFPVRCPLVSSFAWCDLYIISAAQGSSWDLVWHCYHQNTTLFSWQLKPYQYASCNLCLCFPEFRTWKTLIDVLYMASGSKALGIRAFLKNCTSMLWLQLLQWAYQTRLRSLIKRSALCEMCVCSSLREYCFHADKLTGS